MTRGLISIILLAVLISCGANYDPDLLEVEREMHADPYPAKALAMLDSIDSAGAFSCTQG